MRYKIKVFLLLIAGFLVSLPLIAQKEKPIIMYKNYFQQIKELMF